MLRSRAICLGILYAADEKAAERGRCLFSFVSERKWEMASTVHISGQSDEATQSEAARRQI
jgi:hypothetical protein